MLTDSRGNPMSSNKMQIQITEKDITPIVCSCGCNKLVHTVMLGKVSKLLIGADTDQLVPIGEAFICVMCGKEISINGEQEPVQDSGLIL